MVFDNGNWRASPWDSRTPDRLNQSRAVEYRVDPVAMTVEQVWSYGWERGPKSFVSRMGDANLLPITNNVLITFGNMPNADDGVAARIVEVTHSEPADVVFELAITDGSGRYRAERTPSLYAAPRGVR